VGAFFHQGNDVTYGPHNDKAALLAVPPNYYQDDRLDPEFQNRIPLGQEMLSVTYSYATGGPPVQLGFLSFPCDLQLAPHGHSFCC
jgi:hypothetical protein